MTFDARGGLWLDNPLLAFALLSALWVILAALHPAPWLRGMTSAPRMSAFIFNPPAIFDTPPARLRVRAGRRAAPQAAASRAGSARRTSSSSSFTYRMRALALAGWARSRCARRRGSARSSTTTSGATLVATRRQPWAL